MTVTIGNHVFDQASYDADGDVLYLRSGERREAAETRATPEGHAIRFDADDEIIGITVVNAKWLLDRDGKLTITLPDRIETAASEIRPALVGS